MNKTLIAIAIVCLALGGFLGYVLAPDSQTFQAAGDTASSAKIAQVVLDLSTTTPTTVSGSCKLYNGDARDRIINNISFFLTGLGAFNGGTDGVGGVATTTFNMSTSTNVYTVSGVPSRVLTTSIATTTGNGAVSYAGVLSLYVSSTTPGNTATFPIRIWTAGTCLNLFTNSTSSAATGEIRVDYSQGF